MPAEAKEKLSLDFGIEDTVDAGDKEVLNSFFGTSSSANPDDVISNDTDSSTTDKTTTKTPAKPDPNKKPDSKKPEEKKDENTIEVDLEEEVLGGDTEGDDKKVKPDEANTNTNNQQEDAKSTMAALAEEFVGMGIFALDEGETIDPTLAPEEFLKLYDRNQKRQINDTIENFLEKFGEDYKEMFDAVFVNGVDPRAYLQTFTKLQDIASLDMTQEASQEKVFKEYWRRQGFPEDKIEARLAKTKVNGDLEDDSTEFHKALVEQDSKDLEVKAEDAKRKNVEERRVKQEFAQNINKILVEKARDKDFEGIPVTDQIAKSAFEFLTQEKYKLPTGEPLTEFDKAILELRRPQNHSLKVKLALLLMNGLDLTKVKVKEQNTTTSKAFDWATKGRGITNTTKSGKQAQVKETEPFI